MIIVYSVISVFSLVSLHSDFELNLSESSYTWISKKEIFFSVHNTLMAGNDTRLSD